MKKIILFVLAITALLLTSCAAKPDLTIMMWGDPAELDVWNQIVADFNVLQPDMKIKVEVSDWDSYWTKIKTLLAANNPPDIFTIDAPYYLDYQTKDTLLNLQPYIDADPTVLDGIYEQTLLAYQTPDGYFGLPRDFQTIVLFYNKDMFDAAGLAYPNEDWTWEDLRAASLALTKDTNGDGITEQYGFTFDMYDLEPGWGEAVWAYGGEIINADHTKTLIGSPEARQAWQLLYDMTFVDKSIPDSVVAGEYGNDAFLAGVAAMIPMGHWAVPGYNEAGFAWDVAPMPSGPAGRFTSVNSAGFVISKSSPNADAAWQFMKYVLSAPAQTRLAELGFACPVLQSVAESPAFLEQSTPIDHQMFLDAVEYARMKPVFVGYDEWSSAVGDGMDPVWRGEAPLTPTLDEVIIAADEVLAKYK